ncbi:hypothetical protein PCASD_02940 [Puccinia coronata f. sp. avenae]|uniref:F-box domain-containing protein n=1 Tax=Puccinia coronata f. sp. avenae TaxID=200324 RepID=A0A2N5VEF5_9BASI|nr:hypothetical protein PCASD_02940 [Puccinia coronata f. sp. avenae]
MAKLTDLPVELVMRIIHYVLYPNHTCQKHGPTSLGDHHLLDHNQINCLAKPKPRPHEERKIVSCEERDCRVYCEQLSWPKGLPKNPLVPLSLVNRAFRQCAQEHLFKNVDLQKTSTTRLFLKSLTCTSKSSNQRQNRDNRPSQLSRHVRSLQFSWGVCRVTGKSGASLFRKVLQTCPLLENILITSQFLHEFKDVILEALASKPFIKEIVILWRKDRDSSIYDWQAHEVFSRLFSNWNLLETVELSGIGSWASNSANPPLHTFPTLNCAIRTMILKDHHFDELTLSNLLKSCGASMRKLQITGPGLSLNPDAFGRVLRDSTNPNLECLIVLSTYHREYMFRNLNYDVPVISPGVLDIAFDSPTALKNLKTLSFHGGYMATNRLFARLPKSLVKLSVEQWKIPASALIKALVSSGHNEGPLSNLMCCSVRRSGEWDIKDEMVVQQIMEMRGGCFHIICDRALDSSLPTHSNRSHS